MKRQHKPTGSFMYQAIRTMYARGMSWAYNHRGNMVGSRCGRMARRDAAFTIVELLIVIVIIAILAAITIVSYNGIQQRARNSQIAQGVKVYEKALRMYQVDNGVLPTTTGCLGASYPSNQCWTGTNGTRVVSAALDSALAAYISTKPVVSTHTLQITSAPDYRLGAVYNYASQSDAKLIYYLEGAGQTCLSGSVGITEMQGTQCAIQLGS